VAPGVQCVHGLPRPIALQPFAGGLLAEAVCPEDVKSGGPDGPRPLLGRLVAEQDGLVVGVAGLRDADPGPGAGMPGGRWLEACRLAVHPAHRGGAVTRDLITARASRAVSLGADRLWMRCVENSRSHQLAAAHGWTWWARTEFEGPAATQRAILLTRTLNDRLALRRASNADSALMVTG
jgi:GNAT superfamily N-acetyltransferase